MTAHFPGSSIKCVCPQRLWFIFKCSHKCLFLPFSWHNSIVVPWHMIFLLFYNGITFFRWCIYLKTSAPLYSMFSHVLNPTYLSIYIYSCHYWVHWPSISRCTRYTLMESFGYIGFSHRVQQFPTPSMNLTTKI